jgi:hypothetical protein
MEIVLDSFLSLLFEVDEICTSIFRRKFWFVRFEKFLFDAGPVVGWNSEMVQQGFHPVRGFVAENREEFLAHTVVGPLCDIGCSFDSGKQDMW